MLSIERAGGSVTVSLDGREPARLEVPEDDRAPLRVAAHVVPAALRGSRLWFGNGETFAPPLAPPQAAAPRWEVYYTQEFAAAHP